MAFTHYEIDHSSDRFKPTSADRPFVSAVALTHAPVRKSHTDLRFLDRDRANAMVVSFRGGIIVKKEFDEISMTFLGAGRIIGCSELKDFIYENRSRISASCEKYDSVDAFKQDQDSSEGASYLNPAHSTLWR